MHEQCLVSLDNTRVRPEIDAHGFPYEVQSTPLQADSRASKTPIRWGIRLSNPVRDAIVNLKITPVEWDLLTEWSSVGALDQLRLFSICGRFSS